MAGNSISTVAPAYDRRAILSNAHFTTIWRRSSRAPIWRDRSYHEMFADALRQEWETARRNRTMTIAIRERAAADEAAGIVRPAPKQRLYTRQSGYVAGSFGR